MLTRLIQRELARFRAEHPRSAELHERARGSLFGGVPMPWMMLWAGGYPVAVAEASGSRVVDVDGHEYIDLCLGDTGAMAGHAPAAVRKALASSAGITTMLPTEDAAWVGEELTRRFGLARWLFTLTATDANRTALRIARLITARPKVLVFSYCYRLVPYDSAAIEPAKASEIAGRMYLSVHTVRDHLKAIFAKAGVASRGELVAKLFAEHYAQ